MSDTEFKVGDKLRLTEATRKVTANSGPEYAGLVPGVIVTVVGKIGGVDDPGSSMILRLSGAPDPVYRCQTPPGLATPLNDEIMVAPNEVEAV